MGLSVLLMFFTVCGVAVFYKDYIEPFWGLVRPPVLAGPFGEWLWQTMGMTMSMVFGYILVKIVIRKYESARAEA